MTFNEDIYLITMKDYIYKLSLSNLTIERIYIFCEMFDYLIQNLEFLSTYPKIRKFILIKILEIKKIINNNNSNIEIPSKIKINNKIIFIEDTMNQLKYRNDYVADETEIKLIKIIYRRAYKIN